MPITYLILITPWGRYHYYPNLGKDSQEFKNAQDNRKLRNEILTQTNLGFVKPLVDGTLVQFIT